MGPIDRESPLRADTEPSLAIQANAGRPLASLAAGSMAQTSNFTPWASGSLAE
jgi:hypothetical protein